jgi:hypothetical protein
MLESFLAHCSVSFAWCLITFWHIVPLAFLDAHPCWHIVPLALRDANLCDGSQPFLGLVKHSKQIPSASGAYPISIISILENGGCYYADSLRVGGKLWLFIIRSPSHSYGVDVRILDPSSFALWSTFMTISLHTLQWVKPMGEWHSQNAGPLNPKHFDVLEGRVWLWLILHVMHFFWVLTLIWQQYCIITAAPKVHYIQISG